MSKQRRQGGNQRNSKQQSDDAAAAVVQKEEVTEVVSSQVTTSKLAAVSTISTTSVSVKTEEQLQRAEAVLAISEPAVRAAELKSPRRLGTPRVGGGGGPNSPALTTISSSSQQHVKVEAAASVAFSHESRSSSTSTMMEHALPEVSGGGHGAVIAPAAHFEHPLRKKIIELEQECAAKDHENSELLFKLDELISVLEAMSSAKVADDAERAVLDERVTELTQRLGELQAELGRKEEELLAVRNELADVSTRHSAELASLKVAQTGAEVASAKLIKDLETSRVEREEHFRAMLETLQRKHSEEKQQQEKEAAAAAAEMESKLEQARRDLKTLQLQQAEQQQQQRSVSTVAAKTAVVTRTSSEVSTQAEHHHHAAATSSHKEDQQQQLLLEKERSLQEQTTLRMELEAQLLLARSEIALQEEKKKAVATNAGGTNTCTTTAAVTVEEEVATSDAGDAESPRIFVVVAVTALLIPALVLQLVSISIFAVRFSHIGIDSFSRRSTIAFTGMLAAMLAPLPPRRHYCAAILAAAGLSCAVSTVLLLSPPQTQITIYALEVILAAASASVALQTVPIVVQSAPSLPLAWATTLVIELAAISGAASIFILPEIGMQRSIEALLVITEIAGFIGLASAVILFFELSGNQQAGVELRYSASSSSNSSFNSTFKSNPWLILTTASVLSVLFIQLDALPAMIALDIPTVLFVAAVVIPFQIIFSSQRQQVDSVTSILCSILLVGVAKCFHATESTWHVGGTVGFVIGVLIGTFLSRMGSSQVSFKLVMSIGLLVGVGFIIITSGQILSQTTFVTIITVIAALMCALSAILSKRRSEVDNSDDPSEGHYTSVE